MIRIILAFVILISSFTLFASDPSWVKSMSDENVNYFKAVKRYERYWKHHFKPNESEEEYSTPEKLKKEKEEEENDPRRFLVKIFQSEKKAKEKSNKLLLPYKNFQKWQMEMLPYVKSDGSIMTPDERIAAWKQLKEIK